MPLNIQILSNFSSQIISCIMRSQTDVQETDNNSNLIILMRKKILTGFLSIRTTRITNVECTNQCFTDSITLAYRAEQSPNKDYLQNLRINIGSIEVSSYLHPFVRLFFFDSLGSSAFCFTLFLQLLFQIELIRYDTKYNTNRL